MSKKNLLKKGALANISTHTQVFNDVKDINIDDIKLNPFQPRKVFDNESIKELAESIKENGLIQPISITQNNILIAGERRLKAFKLLKFKNIKCIVIKDVNDEKMERLAIIENLQREDLNIFDEALAIKKLVDKSNIRNVGQILGKSKSYISYRCNIATLNNEEIKYAKENNLSVKSLIALSNDGLDTFISNVVHEVDKKKLVHQKETKTKNNKSNADISIDVKGISVSMEKEIINKYQLSDKEKEFKILYKDCGFDIFFNKNDIAIKSNKKNIDVGELLKLISVHKNNK